MKTEKVAQGIEGHISGEIVTLLEIAGVSSTITPEVRTSMLHPELHHFP